MTKKEQLRLITSVLVFVGKGEELQCVRTNSEGTSDKKMDIRMTQHLQNVPIVKRSGRAKNSSLTI